jgi:heme-degrading monooxygenase HmoA
MIRMFVRHKVRDYTAWRKGYDGFDSARIKLGVRGHAVYRDVDDKNEVTVWHDFETVEAAKALASSDQLKEAMKGAGVVSAPTIWFTEPA